MINDNQITNMQGKPVLIKPLLTLHLTYGAHRMDPKHVNTACLQSYQNNLSTKFVQKSKQCLKYTIVSNSTVAVSSALLLFFAEFENGISKMPNPIVNIR